MLGGWMRTESAARWRFDTLVSTRHEIGTSIVYGNRLNMVFCGRLDMTFFYLVLDGCHMELSAKGYLEAIALVSPPMTDSSHLITKEFLLPCHLVNVTSSYCRLNLHSTSE